MVWEVVLSEFCKVKISLKICITTVTRYFALITLLIILNVWETMVKEKTTTKKQNQKNTF